MLVIIERLRTALERIERWTPNDPQSCPTIARDALTESLPPADYSGSITDSCDSPQPKD
jgi:hypothetical protein